MGNRSFHLIGNLAEFGNSISVGDCHELINQPRLRVLQTNSPIQDSVWALLNELFFSARPDVELRVYGHYGTQCDLTFARIMTNVRHFSADCLMRASNVEVIGEIPLLESLSLGIFDLEDFKVLELVPQTLTKLRLGATRSRKPSLAHLNRLRALKVLYLENQIKDIEVLGQLHDLEDVTLRSITTSDLTYLSPLPYLWSLDIKLGGIRSHKGIEGKESIKYFELWQVRNLHNFDTVGALPGLQNLFLQSLPHMRSFPQVRESKNLRRIVLQNLKGLSDFKSLESAPSLEEFALLEGSKQEPEQLVPILKNPKVQRVLALLGSKRKNEKFNRIREMYGKDDIPVHTPFHYL